MHHLKSIFPIAAVAVLLAACNKERITDTECLPAPPQSPNFRLVDKNTGADVLEKYQDFTAANIPVAKESCNDYRLNASAFSYNKDSAGRLSFYFNWMYEPSTTNSNCRTIYLHHKDGDIDTIRFDGYVMPSSGRPCDRDRLVIEHVYFNGEEVQAENTGAVPVGGYPNGITYYPLKK